MYTRIEQRYRALCNFIS